MAIALIPTGDVPLRRLPGTAGHEAGRSQASCLGHLLRQRGPRRGFATARRVSFALKQTQVGCFRNYGILEG